MTEAYNSWRGHVIVCGLHGVGAALGLDVLSTFYAGDEPLLVARLTVTPGGGLTGLAMGQLAARTRVLAIRRAAAPVAPRHPVPARRRGVPHRPLRAAPRRTSPRPALAAGQRADAGRHRRES